MAQLCRCSTIVERCDNCRETNAANATHGWQAEGTEPVAPTTQASLCSRGCASGGWQLTNYQRPIEHVPAPGRSSVLPLAPFRVRATTMVVTHAPDYYPHNGERCNKPSTARARSPERGVPVPAASPRMVRNHQRQESPRGCFREPQRMRRVATNAAARWPCNRSDH